IKHEEQKSRNILNRVNHKETKDRVHQANGIPQSAQLMWVEEASLRLSEMKLGIDLGHIERENLNFDHLMVTIQTPVFENEEEDVSVNEKRATLLRENI